MWGGKSGQHRVGRLLTATGSDPRESATETIPLPTSQTAHYFVRTMLCTQRTSMYASLAVLVLSRTALVCGVGK
jgi:hypothetical protein